MGGDTLEADADMAVVGGRIEQAAFVRKQHMSACVAQMLMILWERSFAGVVNTGKQMKP